MSRFTDDQRRHLEMLTANIFHYDREAQRHRIEAGRYIQLAEEAETYARAARRRLREVREAYEAGEEAA